MSGIVPCTVLRVRGRPLDRRDLRGRAGAHSGVGGFISILRSSTIGWSWPAEIARSAWPEDDSVFEEISASRRRSGHGCSRRAGPPVLQQAMRRVIGRWVARRLRRRPMIVPVVTEQ